ncbi:hypothetical protein HOY80DRAFT_1046817 [Tuber brumale]|nr:hypothetical protein HOY80DRAFT_1046817 [Tuber brumale]
MESLQAVNRYGGFAWAPAGFYRGCAKTRPGGCLGAAGLWRELRISTGLTQALQSQGRLGSLQSVQIIKIPYGVSTISMQHCVVKESTIKLTLSACARRRVERKPRARPSRHTLPSVMDLSVSLYCPPTYDEVQIMHRRALAGQKKLTQIRPSR